MACTNNCSNQMVGKGIRTKQILHWTFHSKSDKKSIKWVPDRCCVVVICSIICNMFAYWTIFQWGSFGKISTKWGYFQIQLLELQVWYWFSDEDSKLKEIYVDVNTFWCPEFKDWLFLNSWSHFTAMGKYCNQRILHFLLPFNLY